MADDKHVGQGVGFDRTRRITGYLVGNLERFNNAKRSEERDRVKHGIFQKPVNTQNAEFSNPQYTLMECSKPSHKIVS